MQGGIPTPLPPRVSVITIMKKLTKIDQSKTSVFGIHIRTKVANSNGDNESVLDLQYLSPHDEYAQINQIRE